MRSNRPEYSPVKTFLFILIGAAIVIAGDVFLFEGRNIVWRETDKATQRNFVNITDLQRRHEAYMREGILPPRSTRSPNESTQQSLIDKEIEPFTPIAMFEIPPDAELPQSRPVPDDNEVKELAENGPDQDLLQDIEPAEGVQVTEISEVSEGVDSFIGPPAPEKIEPKEETETDLAVVDVQEPILTGSRPKIAIIIDDMGLTLRGRQVEAMQGPLTLSYLPYAENLKSRTAIAKKNGHELMVHLPMEAMNDKNGGPRILEVADSDEEFRANVEWGLSQFEGYVGLNNHQGSRLTSDDASMRKLMSILKGKNIYFVDSKTIGSSVAEQTAAHYGIPHAGRDVFLDHEISRAFVDGALAKLEATARRQGYAIAIGHPHKETIEGLKAWLPTLEKKGFELVPASALVKTPAPKDEDIVVAAKNRDIPDGEVFNAIEPSADTLRSTVAAPLE
jgi:polysaccharide deacetylase 2 family uncharacterized protein YibQ